MPGVNVTAHVRPSKHNGTGEHNGTQALDYVAPITGIMTASTTVDADMSLSKHILDTITKPIFSSLGPVDRVRILEQILLLLLILGRWMLPKGEITRGELSQLLLVNIGMAADIIELFEAFMEEAVQASSILTMITMVLWQASLLQFTLTKTITNKKRTHNISHNANNEIVVAIDVANQKDNTRYCLVCETEVWAIMTSLFLQDVPFFVFRMTLICRYKVLSYSNIFFTSKNGLVIMLQLYRITAIIAEYYSDKKANEVNVTQSIGDITRNMFVDRDHMRDGINTSLLDVPFHRSIQLHPKEFNNILAEEAPITRKFPMTNTYTEASDRAESCTPLLQRPQSAGQHYEINDLSKVEMRIPSLRNSPLSLPRDMDKIKKNKTKSSSPRDIQSRTSNQKSYKYPEELQVSCDTPSPMPRRKQGHNAVTPCRTPSPSHCLILNAVNGTTNAGPPSSEVSPTSSCKTDRPADLGSIHISAKNTAVNPNNATPPKIVNHTASFDSETDDCSLGEL